MAVSKPLYVNKWHTFAACAALQLSAGLSYTFSIFSADIKTYFGWSQTELAGFGTALNIGAFTAFIPGIVYNSLEKHYRWGPRVCIFIAALLAFTGMGLVWGTTQGYFNLSYNVLCLAGFMFTNSNAFMDTTSVTCNLNNWPNDRGMAVGVMKAAVGLSGGVYATMYVILFRPNVSAYLFFMMVVPTVSCLLALPFVNTVPWVQRCELVPHGLLTTASRFLMAYQVLFQIMLFNIGATILCQHDLSRATRVTLTVCIAMLVLALFLPTVYSGGLISSEAHLFLDPECPPAPPALRTQPESVLSHPLDLSDVLCSLFPRLRKTEPAVDRVYLVGDGSTDIDEIDYHTTPRGRRTLARQATEPLLPSATSREQLSETSGRSASRGRRQECGSEGGNSDMSEQSMASEIYHAQVVVDVTPWGILLSLDFYLLLFSCFVGMGAGLGLINNLPQLLAALAPPGTSVPARFAANLVMSFSVTNTLGRILAGYLSERALHTRGTPRTLFLVFTALLTAAWCLCVLLLTFCSGKSWAPAALYPLMLAAGASFGAQWTLMATIVSEVFGLRHFAANYATMQSGPMYASYVFPTYIIGALFDRAAARQHPGSDSRDLPCVGSSCFSTAYGIVFGLAVLQVVAAAAVWLRTTWIYERMASHLNEVEQTIIEDGAITEENSAG